jgi:hypothetical protein
VVRGPLVEARHILWTKAWESKSRALDYLRIFVSLDFLQRGSSKVFASLVMYCSFNLVHYCLLKKGTPNSRRYLHSNRLPAFLNVFGWSESISCPHCNAELSSFLSSKCDLDTTSKGDGEVVVADSGRTH